jgi:hypothetical protein
MLALYAGRDRAAFLAGRCAAAHIEQLGSVEKAESFPPAKTHLDRGADIHEHSPASPRSDVWMRRRDWDERLKRPHAVGKEASREAHIISNSRNPAPPIVGQ